MEYAKTESDRQKTASTSKVKLTDAVVKAAKLPTGVKDATLWDSDVTGFGLRIRAETKTYVLAYRPAGAGRTANTRRLKLGTTGTIKTASEARTMARAALGKVAAGGDPHAERLAAKRREKATVGELLDRYKASLERRKYVNHLYAYNGLVARLKPYLGKDIAELTGPDYVAIMDRLAKAGRSGAAADFRSRCSAFLGWCVSSAKVLQSNPLAGYRKQRPTRADRIERTKEGRALSDDQLAVVWQTASPDTNFGRVVRFLILTGCRRNEGAGLTRSMLDAQAQLIRLPATHTKQGRGHIVPVAPELAALLASCVVDARSDLFFPSTRTGERIKDWSGFVEKLNKAAGLKFGLHDLRRTFRTGLSRLGFSTDISELAIGHARATLEAIYNKDGAQEELRKAFTAWSEHVVLVCENKQSV